MGIVRLCPKLGNFDMVSQLHQGSCASTGEQDDLQIDRAHRGHGLRGPITWRTATSRAFPRRFSVTALTSIRAASFAERDSRCDRLARCEGCSLVLWSESVLRHERKPRTSPVRATVHADELLQGRINLAVTSGGRRHAIHTRDDFCCSPGFSAWSACTPSVRSCTSCRLWRLCCSWSV